jgi:hypothetical protein
MRWLLVLMEIGVSSCWFALQERESDSHSHIVLKARFLNPAKTE